MRVPAIAVILTNLMIGGVLTLAALSLPLPSLLPCVYLPFQDAALACGALALIDLAALPRLGLARLQLLAGPMIAIAAVSLWIGSYRISPLMFARGRAPLITAITVTRFGSNPTTTPLSVPLVAASGSTMEIEPRVLPGVGVACKWTSANGGAIDDPENCDIAYQPPAGPTYDVLRLLARPECGLPDHVTDIEVSLAP